MSCNKYQPCVIVLPEDDANRQMALGFELHRKLKFRTLQILPVAGGWLKTVEKFKNDELPKIRSYPERRLVLLIDFDGKAEERLHYVKSQIPEDVKNRVFVLGVLSEPEALKTSTGKSYEYIGGLLADECAEHRPDFWRHDLLAHNANELQRLIDQVNPFLFT